MTKEDGQTSLLDNPIQARNSFLNLFEILEAITDFNYNLEAATLLSLPPLTWVVKQNTSVPLSVGKYHIMCVK